MALLWNLLSHIFELKLLSIWTHYVLMFQKLQMLPNWRFQIFHRNEIFLWRNWLSQKTPKMCFSMLFSHGTTVNFLNRWLGLSCNTLRGGPCPCFSLKLMALSSYTGEKNNKKLICLLKVVPFHRPQMTTVRRLCRLNDAEAK